MKTEPKPIKRRVPAAYLRKLVEEATVDAQDREEQEGGFLVSLEEELSCPFKAFVIGEEVEVMGFDQRAGDPGVVALCRRGKKVYRISVTSLAWKRAAPKGHEMIDAYRFWLRSG